MKAASDEPLEIHTACPVSECRQRWIVRIRPGGIRRDYLCVGCGGRFKIRCAHRPNRVTLKSVSFPLAISPVGCTISDAFRDVLRNPPPPGHGRGAS